MIASELIFMKLWRPQRHDWSIKTFPTSAFLGFLFLQTKLWELSDSKSIHGPLHKWHVRILIVCTCTKLHICITKELKVLIFAKEQQIIVMIYECYDARGLINNSCTLGTWGLDYTQGVQAPLSFCFSQGRDLKVQHALTAGGPTNGPNTEEGPERV